MLILLLVFRYYDDTSLHISASQGGLEVCRLLLQSGADVNARNK
jgi:ankyrin repeat protein